MGTVIVGAIVACIIGLAVFKVYKDRKKGKGCTQGCDGCPHCDGKP